jgi:phosphoserine phosphatase RsbX
MFDWGVARRAMAGQAEIGDRYLVKAFPHGVLVAVVDGLGHGPEAAAAAQAAVDVMEQHAEEPLTSLVRRCHAALIPTRGAVISLAAFHPHDAAMSWLGVGNVEGLLVHLDPRTHPRSALLLRGGVVGSHLPPLYAADLPITPGDTLIFATDGIRRDFAPQRVQGISLQMLADRILAEYGKDTDDALVLVARYLGGGP